MCRKPWHNKSQRQRHCFLAIASVVLLLALGWSTNNRTITTPQFQTKKTQALPLLLINAGRGTTATHLSLEATCHLGLPSVHWALYCDRQRKSSNENDDASEEATTNNRQAGGGGKKKRQGNGGERASRGVQRGIIEADTHFATLQLRLMQLYSLLKNCVHDWGDNSAKSKNKKHSSTPCPKDVVQWKHDMERLLSEMISNPDVQALHDTPYPSFLPYILQQTQGSTSAVDRPVAVIVTERQPWKWAQRRIQIGHGVTGPPLCQWDIERVVAAITVPTKTLAPGEGAFDILGCINRALTANPRASFREMFVSMANLASTTTTHTQYSNGTAILARFMAEYQASLQPIAMYSVNVFEQQERVEVHTFAANIQQAIENNTTNSDASPLLSSSSSPPLSVRKLEGW